MNKIKEFISGLWKKNQRIQLTSPQVMLLGFALIILAGTILLLLPQMTSQGKHTSFLTALFTATSAVCVTGLVVVDTGTHWTLPGQVIIMLLVQIGGLGFMTMAMVFFMVLGKKIGLKNRLLMQESLNQLSLQGVVKLVKNIFIFSIVIELIAALTLAVRWQSDMSLAKALWFGLFHSVAAFNNAGFDLFGNFRSLTGYVKDPTVNLVIMLSIIVGGLGFSVVYEIWQRKGRIKSYSLHTKLVLVVTFSLLFLSALFFAMMEWNNSLKGLGQADKWLASFFQATTTRSAGYNTLAISSLHPSTLFSFIILMFIGSSPGSTGGGIKTTTFGVLILASKSITMGDRDIKLFNRRVPFDQVYRALAVFILSAFLVIAVTMVLTITEKADFLTIFFEVVSAFGNVGITMDLTTKLSEIGQMLITLTMFFGRMGPLTVAVALAEKKELVNIRYPEERIIVG